MDVPGAVKSALLFRVVLFRAESWLSHLVEAAKLC